MGKIAGVVQWPDRHDPHVDRVAERAVYQFARDWQPDIHLHIGDNLDLSGISRWSLTNIRERYEELIIESVRSLGQHFNNLHAITPKSRKVWIWGNHDDRLDQFVDQNPSWRGICDDVRGMLRLYGKCSIADEIEIVKLLDFEDDFHIGKMHFAHGFSSCKHVAAKHVEEYDSAITVGHAHTMQMFTTTKRGEPRSGYVIGHMLNRDGRRYLKGRPTRWVTGFAYMEYDTKTGEFTQHLLPIVNGKFRFAGKTYDGTKKVQGVVNAA